MSISDARCYRSNSRPAPFGSIRLGAGGKSYSALPLLLAEVGLGRGFSLVLGLLVILAVLPTPAAAQECAYEYSWLPAWEIEKKTADGREIEVFVDSLGTVLFEILLPVEAAHEEDARLSDLPPRLRSFVSCLLEGRPVARIRRGLQWEMPTFSIEWQGPEGEMELTAEESGPALFLEKPTRAPIPRAVRERLDPGDEIEGLLLFLSPSVQLRLRGQALGTPSTAGRSEIYTKAGIP